jgi:hypothetical protein
LRLFATLKVRKQQGKNLSLAAMRAAGEYDLLQQARDDRWVT